ncbi:hypothetical protein T11_5439 [Trichinella zimbabwensis]|uniref:Uncharacterized protein n=1 Tax=Trichinella zimbabwensis TaxID=268475 RepID=A0A0V1HNA7_9BILA|nr:hypothetical protein T11_5439 [Trichinella zimbabwensis]
MPATNAKPTDNNNGRFTKACEMASSPGRVEAPGTPTDRPTATAPLRRIGVCSLLAKAVRRDLIKARQKSAILDPWEIIDRLRIQS